MKKTILATALLFLLTSSCSLFWEDEADDPLSCFNYLWNEMKYYYPGFVNSATDWDAVTDEYRRQLRTTPTEAQLRLVLIDMVDLFNDAHIAAYFDGGERYPSFKDALISQTAIANYVTITFSSFNYSYGNAGSIAYLSINSFGGDDDSMEESAWAVDLGNALKQLDTYDALIIDIRENPGGYTNNCSYIAGFFIDKDYKNAFSYLYKTGKGRDDFEISYDDLEKKDWHFSKPVILLMNEGSVSSADEFGVIMSHCTNAVLIGASNAISLIGDSEATELPNGWIFQFGKCGGSLFGDAYNEGDILVMDHEVVQTMEDLDRGVDTQLEFALQLAASLD